MFNVLFKQMSDETGNGYGGNEPESITPERITVADLISKSTPGYVKEFRDFAKFEEALFSKNKAEQQAELVIPGEKALEYAQYIITLKRLEMTRVAYKKKNQWFQREKQDPQADDLEQNAQSALLEQKPQKDKLERDPEPHEIVEEYTRVKERYTGFLNEVSATGKLNLAQQQEFMETARDLAAWRFIIEEKTGKPIENVGQEELVETLSDRSKILIGEELNPFRANALLKLVKKPQDVIKDPDKLKKLYESSFSGVDHLNFEGYADFLDYINNYIDVKKSSRTNMDARIIDIAYTMGLINAHILAKDLGFDHKFIIIDIENLFIDLTKVKQNLEISETDITIINEKISDAQDRLQRGRDQNSGTPEDEVLDIVFAKRNLDKWQKFLDKCKTT